jgi:hypothetical protein
MGPDGAVRPGTGLRRSDFVPLTVNLFSFIFSLNVRQRRTGFWSSSKMGLGSNLLLTHFRDGRLSNIISMRSSLVPIVPPALKASA